MIDTGSDYTVVQREVIIPQLDAEGMELSEEDAGNQIVLHGIGPTPLTCWVQPAGLKFVDDDGYELVIPNPVLVPMPLHTIDGSAAKARVPSLLGRDVLRQFSFNLSYDPPSVSLTRKD